MISVEEYLRTNYEPKCEYVDGVLVPHGGEGDEHGALVTALIVSLEQWRREFGLVVRPSRHIRVSASRIRVPDISVFLRVDKEPAAVAPPWITIEVLGATDGFSETISRWDDHIQMGVPYAIGADPVNRRLFVTRQAEPMHEVVGPRKIVVEVPERGSFVIDFDDLFRQLD